MFGCYTIRSIQQKVEAYLARFRERRISKPSSCQVCGRSSCLQWHGSYERSLIALARTYGLPIKRLLCVSCRHTFALLPSFVVKFHRYAKEVIRSALAWLKTRTYEAVAENIAARREGPNEPNIATLTLYYWRCKFG